jgi:hypothetical protein
MAAYDSLYSLVDYECLLFHRDKWQMKNLSRMNSAEHSHMSFITSGEPNRDHHTKQFMFWSDVSVAAETHASNSLPSFCCYSVSMETFVESSLTREHAYRVIG